MFLLSGYFMVMLDHEVMIQNKNNIDDENITHYVTPEV